LLFVAGLAAAPRAVRADAIDAALREHAPRIMSYIRSHGYNTVGVLKFTVKKGTRAENLSAGPLNAMMAARVEHALTLLNDPARPIDLIHDASRSAASQSRGATFRNARGRRGLFEHTYPLAWGPHTKRPDAFLTGEVLVDKDMKHATLVVQAFDARKPETLDEVLRIKDVPTDRNVLASIGQSFVVPRRLRHRGARDLDAAAADNAAQGDNTGSTPLQDTDDPVKLAILYDDAPVTVVPDTGSPGEVRIEHRTAQGEPKEGQKVKFVITNTSQETIGVVLAVNGKSTLFLEDLTSKAPGECTKWILAPGEAYTIEGFYMSEDGKDVRAFKVLSDEDSAKAELNPDQKGVFGMFVFHPVAAGTATALNISAEGGELARSPKPHAGPRSLTELQAALHAANHTRAVNGRLEAERPSHPTPPARHARQKGGRGLVVEDTQSSTGSTLNRMDTAFDPQPVVSLFIRYYTGATPTTTAPTTAQ
jgi:hypothetical protein